MEQPYIDLLLEERRRLPKLERDCGVVVYGAGGMGRKLRTALERQGFRVEGFIDWKAVEGAQQDGLPVWRPEKHSRWVDLQIVCGVYNRDVSPQTIRGIVAPLQPRSFFGLSELCYAHSDLLPAQFWMDPMLDYAALSVTLSGMTAWFGDEDSRALWQRILAYRISGCTDLHPEGIGLDSQYFGVDLPGWLRRERMALVDAGAYDGDSLRAAHHHGISIDRVYAFEPDSKNFLALSAYCRKRTDLQSVLYPCATWRTASTLYLEEGRGEASRIGGSLGSPTQAISLDECLRHIPIDILKLDVEGAEMETLAGARELIEANRPYLALSIYHRPADLWEIPKFVKGLGVQYNLYIRQHGHNGMDTILYCVPR